MSNKHITSEEALEMARAVVFEMAVQEKLKKIIAAEAEMVARAPGSSVATGSISAMRLRLLTDWIDHVQR